jgi:hypothetical protein
MAPSEALQAAALLVSQFPNAEKAKDGFTASIAMLFADYPRQDVEYVVKYMSREEEFLSISRITKQLRERVKTREKEDEDKAYKARIDKQIKEVEEWKAQFKDRPARKLDAGSRIVTWTEFRELVAKGEAKYPVASWWD